MAKRNYEIPKKGKLPKREVLTPEQTSEALNELRYQTKSPISSVEERTPVYVDSKGRIKEGYNPNTGQHKPKTRFNKYGEIISILFGVFGLFFLSSNITGNVVGLNQTASNWTGGILFILGLIGTFVYFRNK